MIFVNQKIQLIIEAADEVNFAEGKRAAANKSIIQEIPRFGRLETGHGIACWATILFVDLRSSSERAVKIGPWQTYVSMHCLMALLAHLVVSSGGHVANFRGDGLFGAFGLDEEGNNPSDLDAGQAIIRAARCGKAMIEAVDQALRPALRSRKMEDDLRLGVGIDHGDVVITRIGLTGNASELTVYGPAVNHAAKRCGGNGEILLTQRSKDTFPKSKGGTITLKPVHYPNAKAGDQLKGYSVIFPAGTNMLT